jgi:mannose-6-phosphate isomerase
LTALYPLQLPASLRPKIWGRRDLSPIFPEQNEEIGEAWYSFEENTIANGPFAGQTLGELVERLGPRLMGSSYQPSSLRRRSAGEGERHGEPSSRFYFPLLSKLLFTSQHLSVQVHPDDAYAMAVEGGPGKTEMWHIIDAKPGAKLVVGLTRQMSRAELCRAAASGEIEKDLNWVPVEKGQTLFIAPGTLHTIGAGLVICEIQQNSDLTYRFYDFGRCGTDGKPRPLHIEQAAKVTRQEARPGPLAPFRFPANPNRATRFQRELLAVCGYFAAERLSLSGESLYEPDPERFHLLIFLEGSGALEAGASMSNRTLETNRTVESTAGSSRAPSENSWDRGDYKPGDAYLIPAECEPFQWHAKSATVALRSYVPDLAALRDEVKATGASSEQFEALFVA